MLRAFLTLFSGARCAIRREQRHLAFPPQTAVSLSQVTVSEGAYELDYFIQGPIFTILEAHYINPSQGACFVPDFHNRLGRSGWETRHFLALWPSSPPDSAQRPPGNEAFLGLI